MKLLYHMDGKQDLFQSKETDLGSENQRASEGSLLGLTAS